MVSSTIETTILDAKKKAALPQSSSVVVSQPRPDDDLPSNVHEYEQLALLPQECLSGEKARPLRHVDDYDDQGNNNNVVYHYALRPMQYSVVLILLVELLERFSFYGIYYTQTLYLTGVYNAEWNAGLTSIDAASYVSISTAVAYTTPFVGAILADLLLGDYRSILFGSLGLYLPGLALVALTTVPYLLGDQFNNTALSIAVLFLWPMGTGIVKSIVNVFGAKQFHPLLQSSLIESYYVNFYMSINVGAIAGITIIPILAQYNVTVAYSVPVAMLAIGIILFVSGTPRYVISQPRGELFSQKRDSTNNTIGLGTIFRISLLIVPFCIAYSQMPTTFIVQGTVMRKAFGVIDAATMNSVDGLSVLVFGYITGSKIYPALARRGIKISTTYKFAIGSSLGALAIAWALVVESQIHKAYERDGSQICVLWQALSYILIGWGEIFAVSAAYEVAFTASSPEKKVLASAVNIFCVGGIPNVLCIVLYQACHRWFQNSRGDTNIQHLSDYATAHVANYFLVLMGILFFGIIINILPPVREFVDSIELKAAELVKTPQLRMRPPSKGAAATILADEESPLLGVRRHQEYFKYGRRPVLYKMGSMRAGPSLSQRDLAGARSTKVKYKYIPKLYRSEPVLPDDEDKPVTTGMLPPSSSQEPHPRLGRHDSA